MLGNCQSYIFYILSCCGVSQDSLYKGKVVETDSGFIRKTVIQLATMTAFERPTCVGDVNMITTTNTPPPEVKPIEIPSFIEQFELQEFVKDEVGKRYLGLFCWLFLLSFLLLLLILYCNLKLMNALHPYLYDCTIQSYKSISLFASKNDL